jgi:coenzyme PQQ precursor peptide PqqA
MPFNGRRQATGLPASCGAFSARAGRILMKKTWKAPQVIEKPVGLEVTMYLPAEKA